MIDTIGLYKKLLGAGLPISMVQDADPMCVYSRGLTAAEQDIAVVLVNTHCPLWDQARAERDRRLAACDWTQMADAPLTETEKDLWRAYRQALRDLPQIYTDAASVTWPKQPEV